MWETRQRFPRTMEKRSLLSTVRHFHRSWIALGFLFGLLGLFHSIAWDVEFENYTVMNQPVDRGGRGHRVFEDPFPFGERQIAGNEHAAALVAFRQEREQNFHLFTALLYVTEIVDDQSFKVRQLLDEPAQLEIPLRNQQILY